MGYKSDELKEVKWSINSLITQLEHVRNREDYTDDGKYPDSSEKEGDHGNMQRSKKVNPDMARKRGTNER